MRLEGAVGSKIDALLPTTSADFCYGLLCFIAVFIF